MMNKISVFFIILIMLLSWKAFATQNSGQEILNDLNDKSATTILNDELRRINKVLIDHESRIAALE